MTAIIVDDEQLARQLVREFLGHHPEVEIVAECANGFEAVKAVAEVKPDIMFLDIQMPKLSGFEVLELIDRDVTVIFTTAYDEYALKAFEVHAADYLLKPFSRERFDEALEQAKSRLPDPSRLDALARHTAAQTRPIERILVRNGAKVHVIPVETIDYIEAQDDYISIRTKGRSILKQARLSALEEQLDGKKFIRIHRSYILNIQHLSKIEPYAKDSRVAILTDGTRLQVSRAGYAKLKKML